LHVPDGKGGVYESHDFLAEKISGEVSAGDDAAAIGWFRNDELSKLPLTPDLLHYLNLYGVYPQSREATLLRRPVTSLARRSSWHRSAVKVDLLAVVTRT
jgi:hypothetical protein